MYSALLIRSICAVVFNFITWPKLGLIWGKDTYTLGLAELRFISW